MTAVAPQIRTKTAAEELIALFGFATKLGDSAAVLTGTPTVTVLLWSGSAWVVDTTGLTVASVAVNVAAETVDGVSHAIGQAVQATVSAGTAGRKYLLTCTADADSSETMVVQGILEVE